MRRKRSREARREACEQEAQAALNEAWAMLDADRPGTAMERAHRALSCDPRCYGALVMLGDLYSVFADDLGLNGREGAERSLPFYESAIDLRPDDPEAYAGKGLVLLKMGDLSGALDLVDRGFRRLGHVAPTGYRPHLWKNVGENLYYVKALALLQLGRRDEGREVLLEGVERFPGSEYLAAGARMFFPSEDEQQGDPAS